MSKEKLKQLEEEMAPLKEAHSKYMKLFWEHAKLQSEVKKQEEKDRYWSITALCEFEDAELPGMGFAGSPGTAFFKSESDARELMLALGKHYYKAYDYEWNGPGRYTTKTDWYTDHDNVTCFTITFIKEES